MNYIKHLTGFFEKVAIDKTLNPTHVSLYIALFQFWNCNRFKNPISISRDEVMRISKISSKATYHKCLKNLHSLGYINYEPSYNPFKGSHVYLFNFSDDLKPIQKSERKPKIEPLFEQVDEQALNKSCTSDETSSEQALVPSINYINNTNNLNIENVSNLNKQAKNFEEIKNFQLKNENLKEEKSSAKKEEKEFVVTSSIVEKPKLEEVKSYFQENNFPELEAQKFFNYFSSNGWLVGGKTPMVDWQAAAQNWILNSINFKDNTTNSPPNRAKHLNTGTDKDYSEPL
ncbi:transcriptional regulator [Flavobacterium psychraquaticum]|nr:transcriptional regulator [Flavobacterium sp. LB-N7T]